MTSPADRPPTSAVDARRVEVIAALSDKQETIAGGTTAADAARA